MLKEIVELHLKPFLKYKGFKKYGLTWSKSSNGITQVINIQLSRSNERNEENFTINLGIFNPSIWEKCWSSEIPRIIHEEDCFPRIRISDLLNGASKKNTDYWCTCTSETDEQALANKLIELISSKCIPFLDGMLDIQNVVEFYRDKTEYMLPIEKIYLAILNTKIGNHEIAKRIFEEVSAISSAWAKKVNTVCH